MLAQIGANNDAEAVATNHCLVQAFKNRHVSIPSCAVLCFFIVRVRLGSGRRRHIVCEIMVFDLSFLRDHVLEVLQFKLQQIKNGHGWLRLPEIV